MNFSNVVKFCSHVIFWRDIWVFMVTHGGRMTGGSIPHLTKVKETSAKELHARAIYKLFRTTSGAVGCQQIKGGAVWL